MAQMTPLVTNPQGIIIQICSCMPSAPFFTLTPLIRIGSGCSRKLFSASASTFTVQVHQSPKRKKETNWMHGYECVNITHLYCTT